jgi:hypothetical protein
MMGERTNPIDSLFCDLSLAATQKRPGTDGEPIAVMALDRDSLKADESRRCRAPFSARSGQDCSTG